MKSPIIKFLKTLLFSAILITPCTVLAQKLNKPTIDKFNGDTTSSTSEERIAANDSFSSTVASYLFATFGKNNSNYNLILEVNVTSADRDYFTVTKGDNVYIKLADNTIIKLEAGGDAIAKRQTIKKGFIEREYFVATIGYALTADDIKKLLASDVASIRVGVDDSNFDFDLKPKEIAVFKKLLALITQGK